MTCQCGCGALTSISKRNRKEWGHVKGQPVPYIRGHHGRTGWAPVGQKVCSMCRQTLPLVEFQRCNDRPAGLMSRCKACRRQVRAAARRARGVPERPASPRKVAPELNRARVKAWRIANPEKRQAQARKEYQARRNAAFTADGWTYAEKILRRDPCSYCGGPAGTVDHITAVDQGGDGDWPNLTAACLSCNSGKGPKHLLAHMLHRVAA